MSEWHHEPVERTELSDDRDNEGDESADRAHMEDKWIIHLTYHFLPCLLHVLFKHPLTHIHNKKVVWTESMCCYLPDSHT